MKKFFVFLLSMIPVVASGANYLDIKIQDLTRIKQERIAELEKCQDVTGGLKIAGLTTLGISTIGIAANVAEAVVLKQKKDDVTELDKDIEKLNAEIRVYNKLQEGKKVNKGNDIRCGGDVNITYNTYNVTRHGDTYQIQKDGDVYNIDVDGIDIEKLLKGEKDYIDELIRGGKAVRKIENGEDNISVKSNNGQGFHITVENNSGSKEYLVAVQDKKVKFGANVTLTCDFVTVSPNDGKVKIKYRVKDSGDDFSETAPTVTGENENKIIEYSVWVNDKFVDKGEFDCAFYKDDVVVVEEESEEDDNISVTVNKRQLTEHIVGNVTITCDTIDIKPDNANAKVEVLYSLTESGTYTTGMPEITSETPVTVYYKVVNKGTENVVKDKEGKDLVGTISCSSSNEDEESDVDKDTITVKVNTQSQTSHNVNNVTITCDTVEITPKDANVEVRYSLTESGPYTKDMPKITSETPVTVYYKVVYKGTENVVKGKDGAELKGEIACSSSVVVVEEESEEDGIVSVKVNKSQSTEHTVGNVKITCDTVEIKPKKANVEVLYSLTESGPYTKDMPEIPSGTTVNVYYKVVNKTTQAVVTDKDGKDLAGTISCSSSVVAVEEESEEETVTSGPEIIVESRDLTQDYKPSGLLCDGVKVKIKEGGFERDCVDGDNIEITYSWNGKDGSYVSEVPRIINVKDSRIIYFKVYQNGNPIESDTFYFNCDITPVENPIKLDPNQGELDFQKNKNTNTITFKVKDAQGDITLSSSNDNVVSAKYNNNNTVTVTVKDSGKKKNTVVTIAVMAKPEPEPKPNYLPGAAYYTLKIIGTSKQQAVVDQDPNKDIFISNIEQELEDAKVVEVDLTLHENSDPVISWCQTRNGENAIKISELTKKIYTNPHIRVECNGINKEDVETSGVLYRYYKSKPVACKAGYCLLIKSMDAISHINIDTDEDVSGCASLNQDNNGNFLFDYKVVGRTGMTTCQNDLNSLQACWNSSFEEEPLKLCRNWCKKQKFTRDGAYAAKCILNNVVILNDGTCNCNMEGKVTDAWASEIDLNIEL